MSVAIPSPLCLIKKMKNVMKQSKTKEEYRVKQLQLIYLFDFLCLCMFMT